MRRLAADPAILLLAVAQTIVWAGVYYLFPALLLRWEADLGWSKPALTGAMTAAVAVSAIAAPLAGRLIDRGHGRALLTGGALAGGLLLVALSQAETLWQFYTVWIALGFCMAAGLYEPCFAVVTRARGAEAKRAITLIALIAGFAGTVSFPTLHVLAEGFGWRTAVAAFGVLVCVTAAPMAWAGVGLLHRRMTGELDNLAPGGPEPLRPSWLRQPAFWLLGFGFALMALDHGIVLNHLLPILDERGIQPDLAVFAASMIGPMQVAGRLAMMAADRYVSNLAITVACFAAVFCATGALLGAAAIPMLLVVFVVLHGAGYGVTSIMRPVVAREILGQRNFGAISGALALPYLGASAAAPFLGSLLWEIGTYDFVLRTVMGLAALGLVAFLLAARVAPRQS